MRVLSIFFGLFLLLSVFTTAQTTHAQKTQTQEDLFIEQIAEERVSPRTAAIYMDKCLSKIPRRFTPSAHEDFCTCSAAHIRLYMNNGDLNNLNKKGARTPGNESFEKYVTKVIMPCMEGPIVDITYVSCVEDRSNSPFIYHIPKYCQCVGQQLVPFVKNQGAVTSLLNMAKYPKDYKDPLDALLSSVELNRARNAGYKQCIKTYMGSDPKVRGISQ